MPQTNTKDNENISLIAEEFLIEIYKNEVTSKTKRNIESDLLYILSWICRRNKNYSAALKYTEIGLEKFTDDARFYHSRFLINYCKLSELILTESQILSNYNEQLNDIKKAAELYPSLLKTKKKQIKNNITYTILNSEIYTEVLILENNNIHNKHLILNDIRTKLKKLKSLSGSNYFNYPEFLHTESSLEYLEYQYDCTDTESKLNKLNNAIYTINNGIIKAKMYPNFDITDFYNLLEILAIEKEKLKQLNDVNHTVNL